MTDATFKKIADRNKNNNFKLCYEYFCEQGKEKNYKTISYAEFENLFQMWIMMTNMGDVTSGLLGGIQSLKNKHNYK